MSEEDAPTTPVEQVLPELIGHTEKVVTGLKEDALDAAVFFAGILQELRAVESEADLIETFINLSTTAFQGFVMSDEQVRLVDGLLEHAERVAQTFMPADGPLQ